MKKFNRKKLK